MSAYTGGAARQLIDNAISLGMIALLLVWCFRIIEPFISIVAWGLVLAIALATPVRHASELLGGNRGRAVLLFALLGVVSVIVPTVLFAETLVAGVQNVRGDLESGVFSLPMPREGVRDWPVIGERLYQAWASAAEDLGSWLSSNAPQVRHIVGGLLQRVAGVGLAVMQFLAAIVVAALMLRHADAGVAFLLRFFGRLLGAERAGSLLILSAATVRSVAVGVLGIAAIQAVAGGLGLVAVGVPAAGLLALVILVLAVAQLPPWLVLAPVSVYVFSEASTVVAVMFAVWSILVSFADMFLKPMLLGRGLEVPMPVILLGAIGGMLLSGIIGLFLGAVTLALAYELLLAWLDAGSSGVAAGDGHDGPDATPGPMA